MKKRNRNNSKGWRASAYGVAFLLLMMAGCDNATSPNQDLTSSYDTPVTMQSGDAMNTTIDEQPIYAADGFYFLAPMVKDSEYSGTFDAGLSPVVEICETTACATIHKSFDMDGEGSEGVRLDEDDEHYIVNWHTDQTGTEVGQTYRIRVSVAGTVLAHADIQMAENGRDAKNITDDEAIALVDGRTLPIKFRVEDGAVYVTDSGGGTITSEDGLVTLEIPEHAIDGTIGITISSVIDELDDEDVIPGTLFDFGPSGMQFSEPVTITIKYDPIKLSDGMNENRLSIQKFIDGEWTQIQASSVNLTNNTVKASLNSFSLYSIGEGEAFTLNLNQSFNFVTGTIDLLEDSEFYLPSSSAEKFWANNDGMQGMTDIGITTGPLEDVIIPENGYERNGVDIVLGHTYVSKINSNKNLTDVYGALRVEAHDPAISVTFDWAIILAEQLQTVIIPGTWSIDLESGEIGSTSDSKMDLFWVQKTLTERELRPINGALINNLGMVNFNNLTYENLLELSYTSSAINGSNDDNEMPVGTVIAVRTAEGNIAKLEVLELNMESRELTISYKLYVTPEDLCDGVICSDGYFCAAGTCFPDDGPDPCAGVNCTDGYSCHGGTCFPDCTEEEAADPESHCFEGCPDGQTLDEETGSCVMDACADVNCADGYFCSGGACFQECSEEEAADPENLYCFEGCPDGEVEVLDPENNLVCLVETDPCDGIVCGDGYSCNGGACFQDCSEEDTTDPENLACYVEPDPCDGIVCADGYSCNGGACFLDCTEEDTTDPGNLLCFEGCPDGQILDEENLVCYDGPDPDDLSWHPMGSGMSDVVQSLVIYDGDLIAGGHFSSADGEVAQRIARLNGSVWESMGDGMNGNVSSLIVYEGELIAGGQFTNADGSTANRIARWNGTEWHALGAGLNDRVLALSIYNGELIAGGYFTSAGGRSALHIARWDGSEWWPLGAGITSSGSATRVQSLTVYDGSLVVGGVFNEVAGIETTGVARWDGTEWHEIGGGTDSAVFALTVHNGDLVAGGGFSSAGSVGARRVARWNGSVWQSMGSGLDERVFSLSVHNGALIAGGFFSSAIQKWDDSSWLPIGDGMTGGTLPTVNTVVDFGGGLVAGGRFILADGVEANNIARWGTP